MGKKASYHKVACTLGMSDAVPYSVQTVEDNQVAKLNIRFVRGVHDDKPRGYKASRRKS